MSQLTEVREWWNDDEPLMIACPKCGALQEDHDGVGVLACIKCDYCTHPSVTGGVCDICKWRQPQEQSA